MSQAVDHKLRDEQIAAIAELEREHGEAVLVPPGPKRDGYVERMGCLSSAAVVVLLDCAELVAVGRMGGTSHRTAL